MSPAIHNLSPVAPLAPPGKRRRADRPTEGAADLADFADRCAWSPAAAGTATRATFLHVRGGTREMTVLRLASTFRQLHDCLDARR